MDLYKNENECFKFRLTSTKAGVSQKILIFIIFKRDVYSFIYCKPKKEKSFTYMLVGEPFSVLYIFIR